ncbi:MAG: hypothetical protein KC502_19800 [Myxococcales bacterium]|nr:hypothetical protein [Myxococcales bacterium]
MATEELFQMPPRQSTMGADGWHEEVHRYRATARRKSKFKSALSADHLFGSEGRTSTVTTRHSDGALELRVQHELSGTAMNEVLTATAVNGRIRPDLLTRELDFEGESSRRELVRFFPEPLGIPAASYPDMMLPFLMRWQPLDGKSRSVWSWTSDRFIARVYYEVRKRETITVPAGKFETASIWMYPDLNDWIALGGLITKLAKPLLPRYDFWIETAAPHRMVRFEGPYGPPGAPEVVLELAG